MLKIRGLSTIVKYFLSAVLSLSLFVAVKGNAAGSVGTMTQLEYIQWLVQLSGDTQKLGTSPKASDYVAWATSQGIVPAGGWNASAVLTREVLAQTLVQYFNLPVKAGSDPLRALLREGIKLPGSGDLAEITRQDWVKLVSEDGLVDRTFSLSYKAQTGNQPPPWSNGNPPKKNGRHDNGNHYGQNKDDSGNNGNGNGRHQIPQ